MDELIAKIFGELHDDTIKVLFRSEVWFLMRL